MMHAHAMYGKHKEGRRVIRGSRSAAMIDLLLPAPEECNIYSASCTLAASAAASIGNDPGNAYAPAHLLCILCLSPIDCRSPCIARCAINAVSTRLVCCCRGSAFFFTSYPFFFSLSEAVTPGSRIDHLSCSMYKRYSQTVY